jgi:hypothetical protein
MCIPQMVADLPQKLACPYPVIVARAHTQICTKRLKIDTDMHKELENPSAVALSMAMHILYIG